MRYLNVISGTFISRPNRFIAKVSIDGKEETVHVKNTGRCRELLIPGSRVWLAVADNPKRKTKFDLIAVEKKLSDRTETINIDSQAPNYAVEEWLRSGGIFPVGAVIRREVTYGDSRFDFCIQHEGKTSYLEVKGVTLERGGVAMFPDAPTERGIKHINELIKCVQDGCGAYILFVIQMKGVHELRPNDETHRLFGDALRLAQRSGVNIIAVDCIVAEDSMVIDGFVPVVTEAAR